ncbi:hypothetical protein F4803DRAFT_553370 [Xylaria telfairii]|nr:hypothetical protein F4803DRAFT_553370 [Xylaria telfairii]
MLQGDSPVSKSPLSSIPVSAGVETHVLLALGPERVVLDVLPDVLLDVSVAVTDNEIEVEGDVSVRVGDVDGPVSTWDPVLLDAVPLREDDTDSDETDVSVPELGCEFVDVKDVLEVDVEPEPDGSVFVPDPEEEDDDVADPHPEEVDDVTDPSPDVGAVVPELAPDTSVDETPVVVALLGTPGVQLGVAAVVFEFENVAEADGVVDGPVSVAFPLAELRTMGIVVVMGTPFEPVLVRIEKTPEPEDVSLAVIDWESVAVVFPPGPGWPVREVVVEVVCAVPVSGLPVELLVVRTLEPLEIVDEPPLLVGVVVIELDEPLLVLFEVAVGIDGTGPVAIPEGTETVPEMINVVALETDPLEVDDNVFIPEALPEEEAVGKPVVSVLEFDELDELDELIVVPPPLTTEEDKVVGSVMAESVDEGEEVNEDKFPEIEFCVVKKMVDVVSQTGIVVSPDMVVILAEPLVPIVALLTANPEEWLEDGDPGESGPPGEPVDTVGLLLSGGSVNPG